MYVLRRGATLSPEKATEYAARNNIDVPLAGSVLLGIVPPDKAQEVTDAKKRTAEESISRALDAVLQFSDDPAPRPPAKVEPPSSTKPVTPLVVQPAPEVSTPDDSNEAPYDPGFERAVADGHMTGTEAMLRGNREALIKRLSHKYELPRRLAAKVADNELNLGAAVAAASAPPSVEPRPAVHAASGSGGRFWLTGLLAVAMLLALGWGLRDRLAPSRATANPPVVDPEPPSTPHAIVTERLLAATQVRTNETGELVEIIGPDPRSVLVTFCERSPLGEELEPVRVVSSVPRSASTRVGLYRKLNAPLTLFAISIRRDRKSSRWVVGDGDSPITSIERPSVAAEQIGSNGGG